MITPQAIVLASLLFFFSIPANAGDSCLRGDCSNGHGTYEWSSGNQYSGTFKNGKRSGQGVFTFKKGGKYIGDYIDGKMTGMGVYFFPDGSKYEGEYVDDVRSGFGIFTWPNGARYEGSYKNGKKSGPGKFIFPNGQVMNGSWKDGEFIEPTGISKDNTSKKYSLTINPLPSGATIKFVDSPLVYKPQILLLPGRYKIEVTHPNYISKTEFIDINNRNLWVPVTLQIASIFDMPTQTQKDVTTDKSSQNDKPNLNLVRSTKFGNTDFTFNSLFGEAGQKETDKELKELNQQKINTALWENENSQKISMLEQIHQEIELLKETFMDPDLVSMKQLTSSNTNYNRQALVIGNSRYPLIGELRNPGHDAKDVAAALRKLNFNVVIKLNLDQEEVETSIAEFGQQIKKNSWGLFYYAGHGVQIEGKNYLIPVEARIKKATEIRYKAVDLGILVDELVSANNGKNIIILDACRNNPLPKETGLNKSTGLARTDAPTGTLIAYATSPGSVANDGKGRNGVYTKYLLANMHTPNIPIETMFKRILQGVASDTNRKQIPWMSSSLDEDFYFVPNSTDGVQ